MGDVWHGIRVVAGVSFTAWLAMAVIGHVLGAIARAAKIARRMHQIPCPDCQYFTGEYRLKCTVCPHIALSEEAIGCRDFHPQPGHSWSVIKK